MRHPVIVPIVRGAAAMIVGYGVIVLLTSLGFNGVLGGRPLYGSSPAILAAGMLVAVIAGLAGGYTAGFIGPGRGLFNASLVLVPLIGDTIFVLFFFKQSACWWITKGTGRRTWEELKALETRNTRILNSRLLSAGRLGYIVSGLGCRVATLNQNYSRLFSYAVAVTTMFV